MHLSARCAPTLLWAAIAAPALAQYDSGFEGLTASAAGTVLTGQDGYYLPAGTMNVDFLAFTYAGNALSVPAHPNGGDIFIAGTGPGSPTFARAQRDLTYGSGTGTWRIGFDVLALYTGVLPSAQNLGSVSVQPFPGSQSFIALATWSDATTATNWDANYIWFDAAGTQLTEAVPNPAFQNLAVGQWYRWETDIDLTTNRILAVRIVDLTTNAVSSHAPADRYLEGGTLGSATPTGFRFFAGGGVAGNTLAFDNPSIDQFSPACATLDIDIMGKELTFDLLGAAPDALAVLLLGNNPGTNSIQLGVLGGVELGLLPPVTPRMMGVTDASGNASLLIELPGNYLGGFSLHAQAMSVLRTHTPPGRPMLDFCPTEVRLFKVGR